MALEFYNKKMRRNWTPERREADRIRRDKKRVAFDRLMAVAEIPQMDTPEYERILLEYIASLNASGEPWVKFWPLLNELCGKGTVHQTRPRRQALLQLIQRLIRERKIARHRKTNSIAVSSALLTVR